MNNHESDIASDEHKSTMNKSSAESLRGRTVRN